MIITIIIYLQINFIKKFLISLILLPVIATAFIVMAALGKPRLVWGKRGGDYFTRGQQVVVCSFWSTVLLFGAVLGMAASLPRNWATLSLIRIDSLLSPMHLGIHIAQVVEDGGFHAPVLRFPQNRQCLLKALDCFLRLAQCLIYIA